MKTKLYIFRRVALITSIAFGLCSCDLDQFPKDDLAPENSFKTETELKYYLNGLLDMMSSYVEDGVLEKADNGYNLTLPAYITGLRSSSNAAGSWTWTNLRKINTYFEYSGNCTDETIRKQYDGIAYCMRAAFYYTKLKTFGGVPWYDHVLNSDDPELYKERDSRDLVAANILADLDKAIADAPATKKLNEVTKWTALALKSRFCLFEGTFRKYHNLNDADKYLQECVDASEELMISGQYSIDNTGGTAVAYRDLFAQPTTDNASSTEVILARSYDQSLAVRHGVNYDIGNGRYGLNKALIQSYLMADGTRYNDQPGCDTMSIVNECTNRDPRLKQTIRTPMFVLIGETSDKVGNMQKAMLLSRGYMPIKYVQNADHDASKTNTNDIIAYRYAEVLLNFAEAKAELGTLTQTDLDNSIKLIRDRVGMPNMNMTDANNDPDTFLANQYPYVTGPNKGVILEIRRERRVELVMEGLRYDDLMRYKAGSLMTRRFQGAYVPEVTTFRGYSLKTNTAANWGSTGSANFWFYNTVNDKPAKATDANSLQIGADAWLTEGSKGNMYVQSHPTQSWDEDRDYLAPIPVSALVLNKNLEQNPGWTRE